VVGSLEILGSPGAFAVTVGSGIRDFVCLPFTGILQGPWGFLNGVTHGSASLMKHLTAGTYPNQISGSILYLIQFFRHLELDHKFGLERS